MRTRRHFLQLAGAGAAAALAAPRLTAQQSAVDEPAPKKIAQHDFELGLAAYTFIKFPLEKVWPMTKRVGLKHLCLHPSQLPVGSPAEKLAAARAKAKAVGLDLYASGVVYMAKPGDVKPAFDYAKALGLRIIVGRPLPALLPLVNDMVKQYDIRIAIHNHGPTDNVFPTPDVAYRQIKTLDPRMGLCIDIGHTMRSGIDPSVAVQQCADRVFDIHMKDVNAATAKGTAVEVGRGIIDIPRFIRTLDKLGYKGHVSFEYEKDPNDPLAGLGESVGYVRGVMAVV